MTYWARVQRDGPWLESELLMRSDSFEIRPLVGPLPSRTVAYTAVTGVRERSDDGPVDERTVEIGTLEDLAVEIRGPGHGIELLVAACDPTVKDGEGASRRGSGRAYAVAIVCAGVFIVLLGFWNHRSNQRELTELAAGRSRSTTTTTRGGDEAAVADPTTTSSTTTPPRITPPTPPTLPATVMGTTTIAPPTAPPRPTTSVTTSVPSTVPSAPPSTAPPTAGLRLLIGAVSLRQLQHWTDAPPECRGLGQLSDVATGTPVVVRDAAGTPVALGALGTCQFVAEGSELAADTPAAQTDGSVGGIPRFSLEIRDIPDSERYTVQVGRYDPVGFSRAEIGAGPWVMRMVIATP